MLARTSALPHRQTLAHAAARSNEFTSSAVALGFRAVPPPVQHR